MTSPVDPDYNCIAWAAGIVNDWWWPLFDGRKTTWPVNLPREVTLAALRAVFASFGYSVLSDDSLELHFEKVAIFTDAPGVPTHAARQLPNGRWTSKLGLSEDIEHDLRAVEGDIYGTVALILKRPVDWKPIT